MERAFSVDCPRMILRKNTAASPDRVYEGPGSIHQTPEGELMFKVFTSGSPNLREFARIIGSRSKAGEIIPRDEYYSLEATSTKGTIWRGDLVLPGFNQGVTGGPIITGSLYQLVETMQDAHSKEQRPYLSLTFAEEFDFPGNTSTTTKTFLGNREIGISGDWTPAVFEAAGLEFRLQKDRGSVSLSAESKNMILPRHLDLRISEALEFTLFESQKWVIRTAQENGQMATTLRPFPRERIKRASTPPIGFGSRPTSEKVWNLFTKYLEYVISHPEAEWHPLSNSVHLAVAGNANPLGAGLLALSVAVEGVLKKGFPKLAVPDDSLRQQIEGACELISASSLNGLFKRRLLGSIGAMLTPRPKDKLMSLVNAGLMRRELMTAWAVVRNSTVHAADFKPTKTAKIFHNYQSALTLLNELIFLIIGYVGQYTDLVSSAGRSGIGNGPRERLKAYVVCRSDQPQS
jgi:hypothetical protein